MILKWSTSMAIHIESVKRSNFLNKNGPKK